MNSFDVYSDSGNAYYYEYPTPTSTTSTPPLASSNSVAALRRLPIQRAIAVSTSESHSVVVAGGMSIRILDDHIDVNTNFT